MNNKFEYEVRQIDAIIDNDFDSIVSWSWNTSYFLGSFKTAAKDEKRAFTAFLRKHGIVFKKNRTLISFDGDVYEIIDRKTKEPLFAAIPRY